MGVAQNRVERITKTQLGASKFGTHRFPSDFSLVLSLAVALMRLMVSKPRIYISALILGVIVVAVALRSLSKFSHSTLVSRGNRGLELHAFYNVFWNSGTPRIAQEQLSWLESSGIKIDALHVFAFGTNLSGLERIEKWTSAPVVYEQLSPIGNEEVTLAALHRFCTVAELKGKSVFVLYFHPKGSFHPSIRNEKYRQAVGHYVLRKPQGCLSAMALQSCDACSLRFSEYPHAHFPGNMWWANCSYISMLYAPDIPRTELKSAKLPEYCIGLGRFASEHWIGSHPQLRPCDCFPVTEDAFYWYGFSGLDGVHRLMNSTMDCRRGPRPNIIEIARKKGYDVELNLRCREVSAAGDRRAYGFETTSS